MIFTLLNNLNTFSSKTICENVKEQVHQIGLKIVMNEQQHSPLLEDNIVLLCKGEIYNSADLFNFLGIKPKTEFSYEVIIPLYKKYGIEYTLQLLDGVFSFLLLDNNVETDNFKLYVARDPYGVKPLYIMNPVDSMDSSQSSSSYPEEERMIGFSSDKNVLYEFYKTLLIQDRKTSFQVNYELKSFLPGTYSSFILPSKVFSSWIVKKENVRYYQHGFNSIMYSESSQYSLSTIVKNIQVYLIRAIEKRCQMQKGSRFVILLDEGDLGGYILAGLVKQYCVIHQVPWPETYSIRLTGEPKNEKAQKVADHIGLKHTDFMVLQEEWDNELFRQKKEIECYFNLRGSPSSMKRYILLSCWAKHIGNNPSVVFMGTGSQELFGQKIYSDPISYDFYFKKQWANLYSDDETNMALEKYKILFCTPFMDPSFVNYYISLPLQVRYHGSKIKDYFYLRMAFSPECYTNTEGGAFLPEEVIPYGVDLGEQ